MLEAEARDLAYMDKLEEMSQTFNERELICTRSRIVKRNKNAPRGSGRSLALACSRRFARVTILFMSHGPSPLASLTEM